MNDTWPMVVLSELLKPVSRSVAVDPSATYRLLGAHWYARGLYVKETLPGSEIRANKIYRVEADDFVYNRLFAWKGSFAVVSKDQDGCFVSNEFPCFHVKTNRLDGRYLWRYLSRASAWTEALGLSTGGTPTSRNRLKEEKFLGMCIPLPPLSEQRRIVAKIDQLAAKIEEARGLRQSTQETTDAFFVSERARMIGHAIKKGTRPITELAILERGKFTHRPRNEPRFFGGKHPWIQIGEIEAAQKYIVKWSETLNDEGLAISRKFPRGTVLISIAATIGAVGILDFDCCIPDSIVALTPKIGADSEFIYHYLGYLRTHLEEVAPQSAQKNINLRILSELPFPDMKTTEQRRIVEYLDSLQTQVDRLKELQEQTAAELDALLPSVLDKAFKGEL